MEIAKNHWLFKLYKFGSFLSQGRGRGNKINSRTFMRRITLGSMYVAYLGVLKLIGVGILFILVELPAAIFTFLVNLVTIPLGFGISMLYPDEKFLKYPFQVRVGGKQMNLAWFLIPTWIFLANVWFVFYGHMEDVISVSVWIYSLIALVVYVQVIKFAKKGDFTVDFVDSLEKRDESVV